MNKLNLLKVFLIVAFALGVTPVFAQSEDAEVKGVDTEVKLDAKRGFEKYFYLSGDFGLGLLDGENTKFKLGFNGHFGI